MANLTLNDLKSQGLELTKDEAQELAPLIREISHTGGLEALEVYAGDQYNIQDENPGFPGPDYDKNIDGDKLVWEYNAGNEGWCTLAPGNIDENGNLKGTALEHFDFMKAKSDAERGDCSSYWFRQTPASEIGKGDSTGIVKMLLDVDDDIVEIPPATDSTSDDIERENSEPTNEATRDENSQVEETAEAKAEHWKAKAKRLREAGLIEYTITQEDADKGIYTGEVGSVIEIPIPSTEGTTDSQA